MARKFSTTGMHEALIDQLMGLDSTLSILALFDTGAIVQVEGDGKAVIIATTPAAEAAAFSPLCTDDDYELIEQLLADNLSDAMRALGGEWTLVNDQPFTLPDGDPLEFFVIERELAA